MNLFSPSYNAKAVSIFENDSAFLVAFKPTYRLILLSTFLLLWPFLSHAQYTETINSNRPGNSQGAFSFNSRPAGKWVLINTV